MASGLGDIVTLGPVGGAPGGTRRFNPRVLVCQHTLEFALRRQVKQVRVLDEYRRKPA